MGEVIERRSVRRLAFDGQGRRIVLGHGVLCRDGAEVEVTLWCEFADGSCDWAIDRGEISDPHGILLDPTGSVALVRREREDVRIDLRDGAILGRTPSIPLEGMALAADGTVIGWDLGRLVRRTLAGAPRPVWADRPGLVGRVERPLERWLSASESVAALMMESPLPGTFTAPARPVRLSRSPRVLVDAEGCVHLVSDESARHGSFSAARAVAWVRFDPRGIPMHRVAVRVEEATDDACLDASGRLWVRARPSGEHHALVRIDPREPSARTMATSKQRGDLEGFAIDPEGEPRLVAKRPKAGGEALDVVAGPRAPGRAARFAFPAIALANVAAIAAALARRSDLLHHAAAGLDWQTRTETGVARFDPARLEAFAGAIWAQCGKALIVALGLLWLLRVARDTPRRAGSLGVAWILATGVAVIPVQMLLTASWTGSLDLLLLSPVPFVVSLASFVALSVIDRMKRG